MNRSKLKNYAPQARREFVQAVTDRAAFYGLTKSESQLVTVQGDVALIGGRAFPRGVAEKRAQLEERIKQSSFDQVMEAVAYTWFNRLVAIRYMELHGYFDHGYRVLSPAPSAAEGRAEVVRVKGPDTPEILLHAEHVELPGLNKQKVIDLKLDGTKESELFRMLLIAQCNALHSAMPFLFERIDDETELLLPENLLHSDSIVRKLVSEIDEADWQEVEIIGWLYEAYISERYEQVIGRVVKSEDIPAATQRFTPNWIVKYLVQNSLGRQWLATYPDTTLKTKWEYYIQPAEQTPEVLTKLKEITPTSLNPEELTIMDPACGSGHILVEAYDLLKDIYLERGYRLRDIPRLILTKNVYGLEIDDRAAQLACFALLMKAREDDRKIFDPPPQLNVLAIQETNGLDIPTIVQAFTDKRIIKDDDLPSGEFGFMLAERAPLFAGEAKATSATADEQVAADLKVLLALFENAKTYGSLITVPPMLAERLPKIAEAVEAAKLDPNLAVQNAARIAGGFVMAATLLGKQYDAAVANPPYMGSKFYAPALKTFINREYADAKADLYACFMERNRDFCVPGGFHAMINIPNWMFLSSFEDLRIGIFSEQTIDTFIHNGRGVFGSDFGSCAFVIRHSHLPKYRGSYRRLFEKQGSVATNDELETRFKTVRTFTPRNADFARVPGSPVAYWVSDALRNVFSRAILLKEIASPRQGLATGENARFMRWWTEVSKDRIRLRIESRQMAQELGGKWFPYNKGGAYRKWYGNQGFVVNWEHDGVEIRNFVDDEGSLRSRPQNVEYYFQPSLSWSKVTIGGFSLRLYPAGHVFDVAGCSIFMNTPAEREMLLGCMNSPVMSSALNSLAPTVNFEVGQVADFPVMPELIERATEFTPTVEQLVALAKDDWDSFETSWDFATLPVMQVKRSTVQQAQESADVACLERCARMKALEEHNNRLFIDAYGLQHELSPGVPDNQITLYRPDRAEDMRRLVSNAVGCAMGRYSLDRPGLIYAHAGNEGFDPSQYKTFSADPDGIIPITEHDWFRDSAARRLEEFVGVAWPKEHLEENLQFVADSLAGKSVSDPREAIHSYFANDFYKHHLQTYKKRPIYWLFCSGKQRAFQALVYLHRYYEGTLARMRTEYVIPLIGKIKARLEHLKSEIESAESSKQKKRLEKEQATLMKQLAELAPIDRTVLDNESRSVGPTFDEKLRHYADQRIKLDLDDGVKVNYGKFGDLLAEVKAVCGDKEDEE